MMRDEDTNVVYLSQALKRHKQVFDIMVKELFAAKIEVRLLNNGNVWARDYMPVQAGIQAFTKFVYKGYAEDGYEKYPQLFVPNTCWNNLPNVKESDIVLDGGNVTRHGEKAIITDIIFKHNPDYDKKQLVRRLEDLLGADVIIIPAEPLDSLGHSDGICKFIDDKTVLLNDYMVMDEEYYKDYMKTVLGILSREGLGIVLMPYAYQRCPQMDEKEFRIKNPESDDFNPAVGYYVNFLHVNGLIFCPSFGFEEDKYAVNVLKKWYPGTKIVQVPCFDLAMCGGTCNCVSWNILV